MTKEMHETMQSALDDMLHAKRERKQVEDAARAIHQASEALHEILSPCHEGMPDELDDALHAMREWVAIERPRTRAAVEVAEAHFASMLEDLRAQDSLQIVDSRNG